MGVSILQPDAVIPAPLPRLVFLDIDGTVMDAGHSVSAALGAEIRRLAGNGVRFAFATGRPLFAARDIARHFGVATPSMFFSGALVADPSGGEPLISMELGKPDLTLLVDLARSGGFHLELYTRDEYAVENPDPLSMEIHVEYLKTAPRVQPFESMIGGGAILKGVFVLRRGEQEASFRERMSAFTHLNVGFGVGAAHDDIVFANVTSREATRERAYEAILSALEIGPEQVAAFGDSESDLTFLKLSRFGVAMGNAPQSVREKAPFVTATVEEDGVAKALRKIFGG